MVQSRTWHAPFTDAASPPPLRPPPPADLRLAIQQARLAKKMTQKDLAAAIAEKATVINEYESGRAIPNGQIISKMERILGVRLPRQKKK